MHLAWIVTKRTVITFVVCLILVIFALYKGNLLLAFFLGLLSVLILFCMIILDVLYRVKELKVIANNPKNLSKYSYVITSKMPIWMQLLVNGMIKKYLPKNTK